MKDKEKNKGEEIKRLKKQIKELEKSEALRQRAEETQRESEEQHRALYNNAPLSYQSLDEDGCFIDINPGWLKTLGYDREKVIGKWFGDFLHSEWKPHFKKNFQEFKKRGYVHDVQFKIRHRNGHYLDISFEGRIGYHPDGKFKQTYCVFQEITERKQLEAELLVKNEVFEASITANSISDNKGILTYVNNAFIRIWDYENKDEVVGKPISDFFKLKDKAMNITNALKKTGVWEGEYIGLRKDKTTFIAYGLATIIKDRSGDNIGYQSAVLDISDRKRMEETLKESEEKYSSVVENSQDGIIVLRKGIIKFLNQTLLDLTGYNLEELIDKEFEKLLTPEYRKLVKNMHHARLAGKDVLSIYELEIIRKDGIVIPIEVSNTTITYKDEKAILSIIRDISERKRIEEELEKHRNHLEKLIKERTKELEEKNKELERFNKLFVGREFRVKELKDKIKELEKEAGRKE